MAEQTGGEKTLPASPRKIQQARERGQVAKSADLSAGTLLMLSLLAMWMFGEQTLTHMLALTRHYLTDAHALLVEPATVQGLTAGALWRMVPVLAPLLLVLLVGGIVINITQIGFIASAQAITPKLERINPIAGFKRFASLRTFVELVKSILKLTLISYVVWLTLRDRLPELISLMDLTPWGSSKAILALVFTIWWRIALALLIIGILDFGFQRWQYGRDLMMTQQEARDELRQLEGDPRIRQRVRQIQRQVAMQRMMADVPEADVIITNPVRYAVALRYDASAADTPVVSAKGARKTAERIRDIAIEHDVPIVERPELARALFRAVEVGQPISEELFRAVAEVLAYVYEIDRRQSKIDERVGAGIGPGKAV